MELTIKSQTELTGVAEKVLEMIQTDLGKKAVVLAMVGQLGAGKTALIKALGKLLGINPNEITSPTFVLHVPHTGKFQDARYKRQTEVSLDHLDLWRVEKWEEVERLGLMEMLQDRHLIVIEWADKYKTEIENLGIGYARVVWVELEHGKMAKERKVTINI